MGPAVLDEGVQIVNLPSDLFGEAGDGMGGDAGEDLLELAGVFSCYDRIIRQPKG